MKNKKKPTEKQKRFIREKLKGKSDRRAALDAGYSENTADNATPNILEKLGTLTYAEKLKHELAKLGVDEKYIANRLSDSLEAKKLTNSGMEFEDWNAIHKAIEKVNILNDIATEKIDHTSKGERIESVSLILGELVKPKDKSEDK